MFRLFVKLSIVAIVILFTAQVVSAIPFFRIDNVYLTQLDEDSYRLRITVDWNEDPVLPPLMEGYSSSIANPYFYHFCISAPSSSYNYYCEDASGYPYSYNYNADFLAVSRYHTPGNLGNTFGFDFDRSEPFFEPMLLNYTANIAMVSSVYSLSTYEQFGEVVKESTYSGSFAVAPLYGLTPEPAAMILFGLGLSGLGLFRKFKK